MCGVCLDTGCPRFIPWPGRGGSLSVLRELLTNARVASGRTSGRENCAKPAGTATVKWADSAFLWAKTTPSSSEMDILINTRFSFESSKVCLSKNNDALDFFLMHLLEVLCFFCVLKVKSTVSSNLTYNDCISFERKKKALKINKCPFILQYVTDLHYQ